MPNRLAEVRQLPVLTSVRGMTRPMWLLLLLLGEGLLLTLRFDTATFPVDGGWWSQLVGQSHMVPRLALAAAVATFLIGGTGLRRELAGIVDQFRAPRTAWPYLLAHLASFAVLFELTRRVFEQWSATPHKLLLAASWGTAALVVLGCWALAMFPAGAWLEALKRGRGTLLGGCVAGLGALGLGWVASALWEPLRASTFFIVQWLLGLSFAEIICQPEQFVVGTNAFLVRIAPECSGFEGIGLVSVFLGVYLWSYRNQLRFPHALLLIPTGIAIIWISNAVRIAVLVAVGDLVSPEVAAGGFHSLAGWLSFTAIALGLVMVSQRAGFFTRRDTATSGGSSATAAYLLPLLVILGTAMVTGALSGGFDRFYPARVLAAAVVFWVFRRAYRDIGWSWSWAAVGIGVGVFALWMALEPPAPASASALAAHLERLPSAWSVSWLVFRVIGSVFTIPLAEELAFRGYLTRRLISSEFESVPSGQFSWFSFLVSSVLFGALHGRWIAGVLAGMAYALAVYRRGRLCDAVVAHATTNALIAAYVLATGTWSLWS